MKQRILITGATSYIAVNLISHLLETDCDIYCLVRPNSKNIGKLPIHSRIHQIPIDMNEIEQLYHITLPEIDCLYHFAWEGVRGSDRNHKALQENNLLHTQKLLDFAVDMKIPYFIGVGSQAEYGDQSGIITEETLAEPMMEYGKKKLEACNYGISKCLVTDTKFVWVRIFSTYGPGETPETLIMTCVHKMLKNEPIDLSPCEHMWNYLYITELSELLFLLFQKKVESGIYNLASEDTRPLKSYVNEMKAILTSESNLNYGTIPYGDRIPNGIMPDVSKIKKDLDWKQKIGFTEGILNLVKCIKTEKEKS